MARHRRNSSGTLHRSEGSSVESTTSLPCHREREWSDGSADCSSPRASERRSGLSVLARLLKHLRVAQQRAVRQYLNHPPEQLRVLLIGHQLANERGNPVRLHVAAAHMLLAYIARRPSLGHTGKARETSWRPYVWDPRGCGRTSVPAPGTGSEPGLKRARRRDHSARPTPLRRERAVRRASLRVSEV